MIRDIEISQIRPEKLMSSADMARLGCNDCAGCSECCRDRGTSIVLDAWDVAAMKDGMGLTFEELLDADYLDLELIDGVLLPVLGTKKKPDSGKEVSMDDGGECVFLGEDGRCQIHVFRPGICRLYPLARIYHEDGSFSYFLQEGECGHGTGTKIKIARWLGVGNIRKYEQAVRDYHDRLVSLRTACRMVSDRQELVELQRTFLMENFGD